MLSTKSIGFATNNLIRREHTQKKNKKKKPTTRIKTSNRKGEASLSCYGLFS